MEKPCCSCKPIARVRPGGADAGPRPGGEGRVRAGPAVFSWPRGPAAGRPPADAARQPDGRADREDARCATPQHGLPSERMALITSDYGVDVLPAHQMALITSGCAPSAGEHRIELAGRRDLQQVPPGGERPLPPCAVCPHGRSPRRQCLFPCVSQALRQCLPLVFPRLLRQRLSICVSQALRQRVSLLCHRLLRQRLSLVRHRHRSTPPSSALWRAGLAN